MAISRPPFKGKMVIWTEKLFLTPYLFVRLVLLIFLVSPALNKYLKRLREQDSRPKAKVAH